MIVDSDNCIIQKDSKGYMICIGMDDSSGNYIHTRFPNISTAMLTRQMLLGQIIKPTDVIITEDEGYYRLNVSLSYQYGELGKFTELFHSRKLNIIDLVDEYDSLV